MLFRSLSVLSYLKNRSNGRRNCYGYELSACQLEDRTERPCKLEEVKSLFNSNELEIKQAEKELNFSRVYCGTGPKDICLTHYPDQRYDKIVSTMSQDSLRAACRVTGVHIHVGMPDHQIALCTYNKVIKYFPMLCRVGCVDFDGRLDQYQVVVDNLGKKQLYSDRMMLFMKHLVNGAYYPPEYKTWHDFYERAVVDGFVNDPRRLWDFIRISKHGTIEFRMFDSTHNLDEIYFWTSLCLSLCKI